MKILFNVSSIIRVVTGIRTYARELINHLLEIDKKNHYTLFSIKSPFPNRRLAFSYPKAENVSYKSLIFPYRYINALWNNSRLFPIENFFGKADLVHSVDKISPYAKKAKIVTTMLDMVWYYYGREEEKENSAVYRQIINTLKRSSVVITCSEFSKKEILNQFQFLEDKLIVIQLGVSDRFCVLDESRHKGALSAKYPPKEDFILYIGDIDEPRKNVARLISAYAGLKKKKRIREKLLLCGRFFEPGRQILKFLRKVNLPGDIIVRRKWLPDEEIPILYNKAKLTVVPSLYEGFGLPVLESMACGTPVIASNISPIKEIANDAALLFEPEDEKALADSIERILSDTALYDLLVKRGLERRKEFNWKKTALETLGAYERCAEL